MRRWCATPTWTTSPVTGGQCGFGHILRNGSVWLHQYPTIPHSQSHTPLGPSPPAPFPVTYSLRAGYTVTAVNQKHAPSVCLEHSAAAPASGAEQDRNQLDREAMPLLKHCLLGLPAHLSHGVCVSDSVGSAYILSQRRASLDCMPVPQQPC